MQASINYNLGEKLGSGAFGEVFKAVHKTEGREVALKVLNKRNMKNKNVTEVKLGMEIALLRGLRHPNIVELVDFEETRLDVFLIQELCDMDLSTRMEQDDVAGGLGLPREVVTRYLSNFASGLKFLRKHSLVHRDLKPENLLIKGDVLKIADFGSARRLSDHMMSDTVTGTPYYMAYEVLSLFIDGQGPSYDEKCDLWSVGVILYQMITGEKPFNGTGPNGQQTPHNLRTNIDEKLQNYDFIDNEERIISEHKELLKRLLVRDSANRCGFDDFFAATLPPVPPSGELTETSLADVQERLRSSSISEHVAAKVDEALKEQARTAEQERLDLENENLKLRRFQRQAEAFQRQAVENHFGFEKDSFACFRLKGESEKPVYIGCHTGDFPDRFLDPVCVQRAIGNSRESRPALIMGNVEKTESRSGNDCPKEWQLNNFAVCHVVKLKNRTILCIQ